MKMSSRNRSAVRQTLFFLVCLSVSFACVGASPASDPSFECAKAAIPAERAICASPELRDLDRRLNGRYLEVKAGLGADRRAALVKDQRAWLEQRNRCCGLGSLPDSSPRAFYGLQSEYEIRLRELDIARRTDAFTARGWNAPPIHGDEFKALDESRKKWVVDQVIHAFNPVRIADNLVGLGWKDSFTDELHLEFVSRQICGDLSGVEVRASRTAKGKRYGFWEAVLHQSRGPVPGLHIEPDAVVGCYTETGVITVDVNDDYKPREAEYVVTNVSRVTYDARTNTASTVKLTRPKLVPGQLVGLFFDEWYYYRIALVNGEPALVQITDLHGNEISVENGRWTSSWDGDEGVFSWGFTDKAALNYGPKSNAWFEFKVRTQVEGLLAYELLAKAERDSQLRARTGTLLRVEQPTYRPLDFYYSRPAIHSNELRSDFYREHELEPDPRETGRRAVCRRVDKQFVGFLTDNEFRPTRDIGPIPEGFDPAQCRMCMGDEQSRRRTCGFGRFTM
jgi:uncharacterized protein